MPHEEQNDIIQRQIREAVKRYYFAMDCLANRDLWVADLGCGMGGGTYLIKSAGYNVAGFDKSEKAIAYAEKNYPGEYHVLDLEEEDVEGFDIGVCLEVLCHLKEPQKFIDRLKVDELIVSAPIDPNPNDGYIYRLHNLSQEQFEDMFKKWKIIDRFRQKKYLTLHLKRI